jgi:hypothetical protein
MSFFGNLFKKKQTESVVLIDIGAGSVAGAYALYTEGGKPTLLYTRRLPIEIREGELHERAMLHALDVLGNALILEGAQVLLHVTGSGSADTVLVSIDAPWQETKVRTEYFEQKTPFIFSKGLVAAALKKTSIIPPGKLLVDESIIGTILNGYETHDPYGKQVHRASIIVLTSLIDEKVARSINASIRSLYHTKHILSIAGSSLRYQAIRFAFPHERDALILDATGPLTSIALVRGDMLVDVTEVLGQTNDAATWLQKVTGELGELAGRFPLPHTIFLLAREPEISSLRETLDAANLGKLWLSDNPPNILSVLGSHIIGATQQATTPTPQDLSLLLMALYYRHHALEEKV